MTSKISIQSGSGEKIRYFWNANTRKKSRVIIADGDPF